MAIMTPVDMSAPFAGPVVRPDFARDVECLWAWASAGAAALGLAFLVSFLVAAIKNTVA